MAEDLRLKKFQARQAGVLVHALSNILGFFCACFGVTHDISVQELFSIALCLWFLHI